jgi:hypothetical protein
MRPGFNTRIVSRSVPPNPRFEPARGEAGCFMRGAHGRGPLNRPSFGRQPLANGLPHLANLVASVPMNIQIRRAQPRDADFLSWAILAATRSHREKGWFDIVLDRPEEGCLDYLRRLSLTATRSWWHYSRFHIAEADEQVAATLSAFSRW